MTRPFQDQIEGLVALQALTGMAIDAANLGAFTGTVISDNQTIKAALQELETFAQNIPNNKQSVVADIAARDALASPQSGDFAIVVDASADGTVTSGRALYAHNGTAWVKISEFEVETDISNVVSVVGTAVSDTDLGTFTGGIISDNTTIKGALQELETDVDAIQTLTGVAAEATDLGTFGGGTISDNATLKDALTELETAVEAAGVAITPEDVTLGASAAATNTAVTTANTRAAGAAFRAKINGIGLSRAEVVSFTGTTLTYNVPYAVPAGAILTIE